MHCRRDDVNFIFAHKLTLIKITITTRCKCRRRFVHTICIQFYFLLREILNYVQHKTRLRRILASQHATVRNSLDFLCHHMQCKSIEIELYVDGRLWAIKYLSYFLIGIDRHNCLKFISLYACADGITIMISARRYQDRNRNIENEDWSEMRSWAVFLLLSNFILDRRMRYLISLAIFVFAVFHSHRLQLIF